MAVYTYIYIYTYSNNIYIYIDPKKKMARWPSLFFRLGKVIGFWKDQKCIAATELFDLILQSLLVRAVGSSLRLLLHVRVELFEKIEGSKLPKHHGKEITVPAAFQQSSRVFHILHWTSSFSQLGSASQKSQVAPSASMGFFFSCSPGNQTLLANPPTQWSFQWLFTIPLVKSWSWSLWSFNSLGYDSLGNFSCSVMITTSSWFFENGEVETTFGWDRAIP